MRLDLSGAPFLTDAAVALIGKLPQLRELNLSSCASLSDAALHHLAGVSTLQLLQLEALPKVTDAGVQHKKASKVEIDLNTKPVVNFIRIEKHQPTRKNIHE